MSVINQNPPVFHASINPSVKFGIRQCNLISRLCSDLTDHNMVPLSTWIHPIPNRPIAPIASPSLVKIRLFSIGNLMKTSTIGIDDANGRLPIPDLRSVHKSPEKNQLIIRL